MEHASSVHAHGFATIPTDTLAADAALLLDTLRGFDTPVAFSPLWKTLRQKESHPKLPRAKELLLELVKAGLVRRAGKGNYLSYWLPEKEPPAQERMCATLSDSPRSKTELEKNLWPSLLRGWPPLQRAAMLKQLVQTGRVYQWPPLRGNTSLFCVQPPPPQQYLQKLQKPVAELAMKLQRLAQQFTDFGIAPEHFYELAQQLLQQALPKTKTPPDTPLTLAPPPIELVPIEPAPIQPPPIVVVTPYNEQLILEGMLKLEPAAANGALVSLTHLRHLLKDRVPDKQTFDQAALSLAEQNHVALHWHDYPTSLSQLERDELVRDERGNYYIGIALRK